MIEQFKVGDDVVNYQRHLLPIDTDGFCRRAIIAMDGEPSNPVRVIGTIQLEVDSFAGPTVAWVEVFPDFKRKGHGRGLFNAMQRWVSEISTQTLRMAGATPEGEAFCDAMNGGVS